MLRPDTVSSEQPKLLLTSFPEGFRLRVMSMRPVGLLVATQPIKVVNF